MELYGICEPTQVQKGKQLAESAGYESPERWQISG